MVLESEGGLVVAGDQSRARDAADRSRDKGAVELDASFGERIDVWGGDRLLAVTSEVCRHVFDDHPEDIWTSLRGQVGRGVWELLSIASFEGIFCDRDGLFVDQIGLNRVPPVFEFLGEQCDGIGVCRGDIFRLARVIDDIIELPIGLFRTLGADQGVLGISDGGLAVFLGVGIVPFGPATEVGHEESVVPGCLGVFEQIEEISALGLSVRTIV